MNNIIILDNEIKTHNKYIITDSEESDLLWKDKLTITAAGLDRGLRHVRDGYTFLGENESYDNCIINDYLVNMPPEYKGKCNKRLFVIFFERQSEKFFFRALKESEMFVYVKINKNYAISKKKYFQIGNIIFHDIMRLRIVKMKNMNQQTMEEVQKLKQLIGLLMSHKVI